MIIEPRKVTLSSIALSINTGLDAIRRAPIVDYSTEIRCLRIQDISQSKPLESWGYTEVKDTDFSKYQLLPGDIIMARTCSTGINYVVKKKLPAVFNNGLARIRVDLKQVDPIFLYYVFQSRDFSDYIYGISAGTSVQLNMKVGDLAKYEFTLPDLGTQKCIANQLSKIDDKIQLNQQINQTLEQMSQSIFKSWLVDFEPVKAKIAALEAGGSAEDALIAAMQAISSKDADQLDSMKAEKPDQYAELRATAELFPYAMQKSELGEIPEGWKLERAESFFELKYGKALKKIDRVDGLVPVYGSGGINGCHNDALVSGPGIIVGRKGTVGSIYWEDKDFYPIDTTYFVLPKKGYSLLFIYQMLQTMGLKHMNTDAAVPGLNRNNVYRLEVPNYPISLIERFDKVAGSLISSMSNLKNESETLVELRDHLLPKLLSGEITFDEMRFENSDKECSAMEAN